MIRLLRWMSGDQGMTMQEMRSAVGPRCTDNAIEHGLVEPEEDNAEIYVITDKGRALYDKAHSCMPLEFIHREDGFKFTAVGVDGNDHEAEIRRDNFGCCSLESNTVELNDIVGWRV